MSSESRFSRHNYYVGNVELVHDFMLVSYNFIAGCLQPWREVKCTSPNCYAFHIAQNREAVLWRGVIAFYTGPAANRLHGLGKRAKGNRLMIQDVRGCIRMKYPIVYKVTASGICASDAIVKLLPPCPQAVIW